MTAATSPPSVVLVGATGHGRTHLRRLTEFAAAGRVRLAGVCDIAPVETGAPLFTDHRRLFAAVHPDVAVICTPPHTHLPIALAALAAGADLLLEKPPVLGLDEHAALSSALADTGRVCQVGFQALGSRALRELLDAIRDGRLGTVRRIAAYGAWWRADAYFGRVPWAGRSRLSGRPVLDGAVVNPFAHALMSALVIAQAAGAGRPERMRLERYRVADIEVDDTTCLRVYPAGGPPVLVAVSLRSQRFLPGEIVVTGDGGRARLEYPTDRLSLPGEEYRDVPGREDLLSNLLAYRAGRAELRAPLAATAPFTAIAEAVAGSAAPRRIGPPHVVPTPEGGALVDIADLVRRAAEEGSLYSEMGVAWAAPSVEVPLAHAALR